MSNKSIADSQPHSRLHALAATGLLDSPPEQAFDRFTRLANKLLGTPLALVSLVDRDRQFFKSQIGLQDPWATARETPLSHSFCQYVVRDQQPLVVPDARCHAVLRHNPAIDALGVIAYLGVPLTTSDGDTLGALCAIDTKPREWNQQTIEILTDLAAFVMTEIELRLLGRQLDANYRRLQRLEVQRTEMVNMLVHDLRNPLTSVIGGLDLLADATELDAVAGRDVAMARQGAGELLRMIDDILDVSKAEADQLGLFVAECAPDEIVTGACEQLAHLAAASGVTLVRAAAGQVPSVMADGAKLRRALVNLIANAIQHCRAGGRVTVSACATANGSSVRFTVADTGTGIPPEALHDLFDKFRNTRHNRTDRRSTGLGLPFCKMVAEAHGGCIEVESIARVGTTFHLTVPRDPGCGKEVKRTGFLGDLTAWEDGEDAVYGTSEPAFARGAGARHSAGHGAAPGAAVGVGGDASGGDEARHDGRDAVEVGATG